MILTAMVAARHLVEPTWSHVRKVRAPRTVSGLCRGEKPLRAKHVKEVHLGRGGGLPSAFVMQATAGSISARAPSVSRKYSSISETTDRYSRIAMLRKAISSSFE